MVSKKQMTITDAAMEKLRASYASVKGSKDYGNGRFVRKMLEEAEMNLAERVSQLNESDLTTSLITTLEECDIPKMPSMAKTEMKKIGFAISA